MCMWIMKSNLLLLLLAFLAVPVWAAQSGRDQPISIDADRIEIDDAKKITTFEGNVVLTQGTLTIKADKVVVTQDAKGNKHATAYSGSHPVHFTQKQAGTEGEVEGEGTRAEYDSMSDTVELFGNAYVKRGQDIVKGNYISYDSKTEFFKSQGSVKGPRVHAVIQPRKAEGK